VLLISAGAIEGHFEGKTRSEVHQSCPTNALAHRALATQKKLAYLGFLCLDHPPYYPDLVPSDYHLFPGLNQQLIVRNISSDLEFISYAETWLYGQKPDFFLSGLLELEQRAMKCIELRGEYVE
jgi:histone-lysine N-methyltransferase SETMAR